MATEAEIEAGRKAMRDTFRKFGLRIAWELRCIIAILEAAERVRASANQTGGDGE